MSAGPILPWLEPGKIKAKTAAVLASRSSRAMVSRAAADDVIALASEPDSHVFALTGGQYSLIDLVVAALDRSGPADVAIWTWCIADYELQSLSDLVHDGRLRRLRLVIDRAGALRQRHFLAWFLRRFGADSLRITLTHAKVATVVAPGWDWVIRGSANLNANQRIEQVDVSNSAPALEMIEGVMSELWARVSPVPRQALEYGECSRAFSDVFGDGGGGIVDDHAEIAAILDSLD